MFFYQLRKSSNHTFSGPFVPKKPAGTEISTIQGTKKPGTLLLVSGNVTTLNLVTIEHPKKTQVQKLAQNLIKYGPKRVWKLKPCFFFRLCVSRNNKDISTWINASNFICVFCLFVCLFVCFFLSFFVCLFVCLLVWFEPNDLKVFLVLEKP